MIRLIVALLIGTLAMFSNELILINGKIATMNLKNPFSEAIVIKENRIVFVGSSKDALKYKTSSSRIINLNGRVAIPGFNDCHLHFLSGGKHLHQIELYGLNLKQIKDKVREAVKKRKRGEWIIGRGWDQGFFSKKEFPDKKILDEVSPENPVLLVRVDGHVGWANSMALKLAGINSDTKQPEGGEIEKYENGEPTGILKENALGLIEEKIPEDSKKSIRKYIKSAIEHANRLGITSIQDMSHLSALDIYEEFLRKEKLTLRINFWGNFDKGVKYNLKLRERIQKRGQGIITFGIVKGFIDGTLGSRTAKMFYPYNDNAETSGMFTIDLDDFFRKLYDYEKNKFQVGFHAIGDMGVWMVLNGYEAIYKGFKRRDRRWRIEHSQTVMGDDLIRYKKYSVIASIQPLHLIYDLLWAKERLGNEREKEAYRLGSFIRRNINVCFGTDWPVAPLNPMLNLYSAMVRKDLKGFPENGFVKKEAIKLYKAIYLYTMGSAYAEFKENEKGSIEPGKLADITVLSKDIFKLKPEEILKVKVDYTIFNGKIVYERKGN